MQRLDRQRHACLLRIFQHFGDGIANLHARGGDVFRGRASGAGILRQAAGDQHDAGCAQCPGLVDRAAIIVAGLDAVGRIRREHAAAAIA
jgi:hypothetical protein